MSKKIIAILCCTMLVFSQCLPFGVLSAKDRTAPVLKLATPRNGQTGVSIIVKISVKFKVKDCIKANIFRELSL